MTKNLSKGGYYLIEILKKIKDKNNLLFINIGEQDSLRINGMTSISIPQIFDETTLALYYSACDIFIFSSLAENFPLVILEAMSCGKPVIAFRVGGIPELVDHMKTGYLAEYKNTDDFVCGVNMLLSDNNLRAKFGDSAVKKVRAELTLRRQARQYLSLYEDLIKAHKLKYAVGSKE